MGSKSLVIVGFRGGDASNAHVAWAVDVDQGSGPVWLALVEAEFVSELAVDTGGVVAVDAEPWDGSRFGDGAGTIERVDGKLVGTGCYRHLSE